MRLAWPAGSQPADPRRSRYRVPSHGALRPVWLPVRTYPGGIQVPCPARESRLEGTRDTVRAHPRLLDQSDARGGRAAAIGGRTGAHDQSLISVQPFIHTITKLPQELNLFCVVWALY